MAASSAMLGSLLAIIEIVSLLGLNLVAHAWQLHCYPCPGGAEDATRATVWAGAVPGIKFGDSGMPGMYSNPLNCLSGLKKF